jgi:hypothetical protein
MKNMIRALTLAELVIAVTLVGMVILGVFAAETALRRVDKEISGSARLSIELNTLASMIRDDARRMHGDGMNPACVVNTGLKSVWFRQDIEVSSVYTPANYADDRWKAYTLISSDVYGCVPPNSSTPCVFGVNNAAMVGRVVPDLFSLAPLPNCYVNVDGNNYFEMTLVSRVEPAAAVSMDNPQVAVSLRENAAGF